MQMSLNLDIFTWNLDIFIPEDNARVLEIIMTVHYKQLNLKLTVQWHLVMSPQCNCDALLPDCS